MVFCACGCGEEVKEGNVWIRGHCKRKLFCPIPTLCSCGCGREIVFKKHHRWKRFPKYIRGHFTKHFPPKGMCGKKHDPEVIEKMRDIKIGKKNPFYGKKHSKETLQKMRDSRQGENAPNWQGGLSFIPYCKKFNEELREKVRERDGRTCQLCGKSEVENQRKLSVHHIHYDKENCEPDMVSLCNSCNSIVNYNRNYYERLFMDKLKNRNLLSRVIENE